MLLLNGLFLLYLALSVLISVSFASTVLAGTEEKTSFFYFSALVGIKRKQKARADTIVFLFFWVVIVSVCLPLSLLCPTGQVGLNRTYKSEKVCSSEREECTQLLSLLFCTVSVLNGLIEFFS